MNYLEVVKCKRQLKVLENVHANDATRCDTHTHLHVDIFKCPRVFVIHTYMNIVQLRWKKATNGLNKY